MKLRRGPAAFQFGVPSAARRPRDRPTVAVIGCGIAGIAAAVKLTQAGITGFTVFEKSGGIGGTWWDNRYPGAATDTSVHMYSYSFMPFDWSATHAGQEEIQRYLEAVVDRFGIRSHIQLGNGVEDVSWDEQENRYHLRSSDGTAHDFDVVISAVGLLNVPRYPEWPGLEDFVGPCFHTARWESQHDLSDQVVAVVGTGSSAAQVVPALARIVRAVHVFQREPGWVQPKEVRTFSAAERARLQRPWARRLARLKVFYQAERDLATGLYDESARTNQQLREASETFVRIAFADRPDLQKIMTPTYPYLCKRVVKSSDFYPALLRDNVHVVPKAVTAVTEHEIVDSDGVKHAVDAIVLATGFEAERYLATLSVRGRNGRLLDEEWNGDPAAFLGITVPNFPNLFILFGPNTNGGALIFNFERQAEYAVRAIKRMRRRGLGSIEVRPSIMDRYEKWVQAGLEKTTYAGSCHNYFRSPTGRIVTQWPYTMSTYWLLTRTLGAVSSVTSRSHTQLRSAHSSKGS